MVDKSLHKWVVLGVVAAAVVVLAIPLYVMKERLAGGAPEDLSDAATFVGREACLECHETAYRSWVGSNHDDAMDVATDSTVLGNFDNATFEQGVVTARFFRRDGRFYVHTQGPDGENADFEITHTFGIEPLQQYLIPFPGGRLQSLTIAWDTERERWFHLYPDRDVPPNDWLHWTRNGQNWNGMCAECHSTNLVKGYDAASSTYETTWSEIDVSCEACHGPSSRHVEWAKIPPMARPEVADYALTVKTRGLTSRQQVDLCAPCHSRRTAMGDYNHTSVELLDHQVPQTLADGLYHADGQILDEVYVYGSFLQSKMHRNNVKCSDCHDVHSLELRFEGNALCLQCHQPQTYDRYDHHFHKREHEGKPSDGHLCVKCHMPEQPFMVVDWRADHSIRVPRPDLSPEIGTPNACDQVACHADQTVEWAVEHYREWYGKSRKPHFGTTFAAGRAGDPGAVAELAHMSGDTLYPAIVRATALTLLDPNAAQGAAAFRSALADEDPLVRYTAVSSLGGVEAAELVERVAPLLFDPVRAVRMQAAVRLAPVPLEMLEPYQASERDSALADYERAMAYSLDFAFAGHNLGNLYASLNRYEEAESSYRTAIAIDDLFYPAKVNLAMLYNGMGRNAESDRLLREVLEDYPDLHDVSYSLGLLLVELGRAEEALAYMGRAAQGLPGRARVQYNYGLLQQQFGRVTDAEASLRTAVELEPDNLDFLYALADHYVRRGELQSALVVADRMVAAHPQQRVGHDIKSHIEGLLNR